MRTEETPGLVTTRRTSALYRTVLQTSCASGAVQQLHDGFQFVIIHLIRNKIELFEYGNYGLMLFMI